MPRRRPSAQPTSHPVPIAKQRRGVSSGMHARGKPVGSRAGTVPVLPAQSEVTLTQVPCPNWYIHQATSQSSSQRGASPRRADLRSWSTVILPYPAPLHPPAAVWTAPGGAEVGAIRLVARSKSQRIREQATPGSGQLLPSLDSQGPRRRRLEEVGLASQGKTMQSGSRSRGGGGRGGWASQEGGSKRGPRRPAAATIAVTIVSPPPPALSLTGTRRGLMTCSLSGPWRGRAPPAPAPGAPQTQPPRTSAPRGRMPHTAATHVAARRWA